MLIECVPNFSCGPEIAQALCRAIDDIPRLVLLGCESDSDHMRSVITLAGPPEAVLAGAKAMVREAVERIDLSTHKGVHPRFGAADVVPFIPLEGASLSDCVAVSREFGAWAAEELALPVYFYEAAAQAPERRDLAALRRVLRRAKKEGASLPKPDLGPGQGHPRAGVLITGARFFLLAFNVNLKTKDIKVARRIAKAIRASSGGLPAVKALAFRLESRGQVQVSMNLVDYRQTGPVEATRRIEAMCREAGVEIADTELIGLIPQEALEQGLEQALGCSQELSERVIERLISRSIFPERLSRDLESLASKAHAPGGGSAAAIAGALGTACFAKALTLSEEQLEEHGGRARAESLLSYKKDVDDFLRLADQDRRAFSALMASYKIPRSVPKGERLERRRCARRAAFESSEALIEKAEVLFGGAEELLELGNANLMNDVALGAEMVVAAAQGGFWNALSNLSKAERGEVGPQLAARLEALRQRLRGLRAEMMRRNGLVDEVSSDP